MLKRIIIALLIALPITKIEEIKMEWQTSQNGLTGGSIPIPISYSGTPGGYTGGSSTGITQLTPYTQSGLTYDNGGWIPEDNVYQTGVLGSPTTIRPVVDPYANWGGKANFNNLQSGFNTQKQMIGDTAGSAFDTAAGKYNRSILDFLDSARLGQQTIDNKSTENELAKMQGTSDILGMVGRGIRSGGVMLNNKNSSDSSGAEAIALAYGDIGQREMGKVGNQYETGKMGINDMQDAFDVQQKAGVRNLQGSRDDSVNTIMGDVSKSLAELDAKMVDASMPERIAIEQEKARIKAAGIAKLQAYDSALTSGVKDIGPMSRDEVLQKAGTMRRAGTNLGAGMFDYTTQAPIAMQGQEPAGANLPLFVLPRNRKGV